MPDPSFLPNVLSRLTWPLPVVINVKNVKVNAIVSMENFFGKKPLADEQKRKEEGSMFCNLFLQSCEHRDDSELNSGMHQ